MILILPRPAIYSTPAGLPGCDFGRSLTGRYSMQEAYPISPVLSCTGSVILVLSLLYGLWADPTLPAGDQYRLRAGGYTQFQEYFVQVSFDRIN